MQFVSLFFLTELILFYALSIQSDTGFQSVRMNHSDDNVRYLLL